jgi:hypothetical protein
MEKTEVGARTEIVTSSESVWTCSTHENPPVMMLLASRMERSALKAARLDIFVGDATDAEPDVIAAIGHINLLGWFGEDTSDFDLALDGVSKMLAGERERRNGRANCQKGYG